MNVYILAFLVVGAAFGVATRRHQHLFSEGCSDKNKQGPWLLWVPICSFLWPLMVLTGLHSWWRLSRAAAAQRR